MEVQIRTLGDLGADHPMADHTKGIAPSLGATLEAAA